MPATIQGQMLRRSSRREVAIYLHGGVLWVADFIDGDGHLVDAVTWIRFNCGSPSTYHARRRMMRECALPVSRELAVRIERLHLSPDVSSPGACESLRRRVARGLRRMFRDRRSGVKT